MAILDQPDLVLPKGSLILVTGASGYIASNIVVECLKAGYRVRGSSRTQSRADGTKQLFNSINYEAVVVSDMTADGAFDEAVKGVDAIIHAASPVSLSADPNLVVVPAVKGTITVMASALKEPKVKRFVLTSSSCSATLALPNKKKRLDKNTWNTDSLEFADYPPPYPAENGFNVYAASKTKGEMAMWDFVKEHKPHYVCNAVLPNYNMGRRIDPKAGSTGSWLINAFNGNVPFDTFPPQWMIDVIDDARLHLIAAIDGSLASERIYAFAYPFTWNDVLAIFRELRPDFKYPDDKDCGRDIMEVDNQLGAELLKKWFGQDGYTSLKDSVKQNLQGVN